MSLKPFREVTPEAIERVSREVFRQWAPLIRDAQQVSVLLWTADGSEILTYSGDLSQQIEWGRYIGSANPHEPVKGDKDGISLHSRAYLYTENPPIITCQTLKLIVDTLRRVGREMTGLPVRIGETFDPGCEFAVSPFKYQKHREVCLADTGGPASFMCCYATLDGDSDAYAGFPNGIPDKTPLGTFLGRQTQHFLRDIGFDYLWFSNGFGFGLETWMTRGPMFDGTTFDATRAREIRELILNFWRKFREECPDYRIETRGTNLSTGIDLASDGVPLREMYEAGFNFAPPPNSPWAALNSDFGLELTGWMSHIAELPPGSGYPFRFYTHDPWWHNSPWLDRYGREAHDLYLPLSVSRITDAGEVQLPDSILFLTIDDSFGQMPVQVPNEVIPVIQQCRRLGPDAPGPLVWVYPFDEYHEMTFGDEPRIDEPFFGDWFIRSAIRNGLPLNTVVSTRAFMESSKAKPALYRHSILVTTVPDKGSPMTAALLAHVRSGGKVLLYGPARRASQELLDLLGIRIDAPLDGELELLLHHHLDQFRDGKAPTKVIHRPHMSAGGCEEVAAGAFASLVRGTQQRAAGIVKQQGSRGAIAWVRGTCAGEYVGGDLISGVGHLPKEDDRAQVFHADMLMRHALAQMGMRIQFAKREPRLLGPIMTISRHRNAFIFNGFTPDMTVETRLRLPQGAPVFIGTDTELMDGMSTYRMPRAWTRECRVFVEQAAGPVTVIERTAERIDLIRRLRVLNLKDATVRFFHEPGRKVTMTCNASYPFLEGPFVDFKECDDELGKYLKAEHITGELMIGW